ncbi:uncharacterized protein LOC128726580 [Anopheles nili]|uniref:uncharacterized protein LOC128726580 n=1 Tax=Anopheles nili TaxID=185578 RepID=UPI00237A2502|nr:uncharacterized protein LOC128726580 [Anopheles nili]
MADLSTNRRILPVLMLAVLCCIPSVLGCDKPCDRYQYCDENNNSCRNCSVLCDKDQYSCLHKCQTYMFMALGQQVASLQTTVAMLKIVCYVVMLLLCCIALCLVAMHYKAAIRKCCRWRPQAKKAAPVGYTHENPNTKSPKAIPKNGANVPKQPPASTTVSIYPETEADNSVQTGTTSISNRYPAEDSTESYSYDNAACNVTPTSNNPMPKF